MPAAFAGSDRVGVLAGSGLAGDFAPAFAAGFEGPAPASFLRTPMKLLRRAGAVGGVTLVAPHRAAVADATPPRGAGLGFAFGFAAARAPTVAFGAAEGSPSGRPPAPPERVDAGGRQPISDASASMAITPPSGS
ncbi:MAG: hypothetical protein E6G66_04840 [Actinobacteria bacterium]|nr:MAG: hypothetical protein E6G66_04840 [Actinomycetota bacterium]